MNYDGNMEEQYLAWLQDATRKVFARKRSFVTACLLLASCLILGLALFIAKSNHWTDSETASMVWYIYSGGCFINVLIRGQLLMSASQEIQDGHEDYIRKRDSR